MPVALAGSVPLADPKGLSAVLASSDPARFFEEFANFEAYFYPLPLEEWPPLFRMYHLVSMVDISINTGDLASFFDDDEDHTGAYAHETEAFLRDIGAPRAAALLADAIHLYPQGQVPKHHATRGRVTEKLRDKDPEPFEEVVRKHEGAFRTMYAPLQAYLRAHERELQKEVDRAARTAASRTPQWLPLDEALKAEVPADRNGVSQEYIVLLAVWDRIHARMLRVQFEGLTPGERLLHLLWFVMDSDIRNGGLHQFLSNSSGEFTEEIKQHLQEIGATKPLAVLTKASAVVPAGVVPEDRLERNEVLDKHEEAHGERSWDMWDDLSREYHEHQNELYLRLVRWVTAHRDQFPDPDRPAAPEGNKRAPSKGKKRR